MKKRKAKPRQTFILYNREFERKNDKNKIVPRDIVTRTHTITFLYNVHVYSISVHQTEFEMSVEALVFLIPHYYSQMDIFMASSVVENVKHSLDLVCKNQNLVVDNAFP